MKKRLFVITAVGLCIILFFVSVAGAMDTKKEMDMNIIREKLNDRFLAMMDDRNFSGVAYAVYKGSVVFDGGRGEATDDEACTSDTAFGVASVSKQFTAASIMQLYDRGKLDVKDKLSKYFPDYKYGDKITVEHLLYQRSGIPDFAVENVDNMVDVVTYGDEYERFVISDKGSEKENRDRIREYFLSKDLLFEPGEMYDYSDSNYSLLAEIVSQVSGMEYHDYVRQNIFKPLLMKHSTFIDNFDEDFNETIAAPDLSEFGRNYFEVKGLEYGCGDILTTPKDLYRWYKGLMGGQVVKKDTLAMMTQNYSKEEELGYGYGLMVSDTSDSKTLFHYGYVPSYYSSVFYIPEQDFFMTVIANRYGEDENDDPHELAADMAKYAGRVIGVRLRDIE